MTREPLTAARIRPAHNRRCPYCRSDSSPAVGTRVPSGAPWAGLALPGASVLEIGPGSGHLLAAARAVGCSVEAVESSAVHRDYIRDTWGIGSLYPTMAEIPDGRTFDTIVAIPCDPVYRLRGALGRAGSLKARLTG